MAHGFRQLILGSSGLKCSMRFVIEDVVVDLEIALRILGMSRGVKNMLFEAPGVSLGGSGVSIGGVKILGVTCFFV